MVFIFAKIKGHFLKIFCILLVNIAIICYLFDAEKFAYTKLNIINLRFTSEKLHQNWIIFNADYLSENELSVLMQHRDWTTLIITNSTTLKSTEENILIFDIENERNYFEKLDGNLQNEISVVTNYAFLYAIRNGAKLIFHTDKETVTNPNLSMDKLESNDGFDLMPTSQNSFNVSLFYDDYPQDYNSIFLKKSGLNIFVKQILGTSQNSSLSGTSTPKPNLIMPLGTVTNYGKSTSYLFKYDSFWGMSLLSNSADQSLILRNFLLQKLLILVNGYFAYTKLSFLNYNAEELWEKPERDSIINLIDGWRCTSKSVQTCMENFIDHLVDNSDVIKIDASYLRWWNRQLRKAAYYVSIDLKENDIQNSRYVEYYPPLIGSKRFEDAQRRNTEKIKKYCPNSKLEFQNYWHKKFFDDIFLVISYNQVHVKNIPIIESLYGQYFPNHIFCAPTAPPLEILDKEQVSYIQTQWLIKDTLSLIGDCFTGSYKVSQKVGGLLHISDDVLIFPWNLRKFDKNKIWLTFDRFRQPDIADLKTGKALSDELRAVRDIPGWIERFKLSGLEKTLDELRTFNKSTAQRRCSDRLEKTLKGKYRFYYGQADIFYVPPRYLGDFITVLNVFNKHIVSFEIAVQTVLRCITDEEFIYFPWMHFDTGSERNNIIYKYEQFLSKPYVHPYKFGVFLNNGSLREKVLCNKVYKSFVNK